MGTEVPPSGGKDPFTIPKGTPGYYWQCWRCQALHSTNSKPKTCTRARGGCGRKIENTAEGTDFIQVEVSESGKIIPIKPTGKAPPSIEIPRSILPDGRIMIEILNGRAPEFLVFNPKNGRTDVISSIELLETNIIPCQLADIAQRDIVMGNSEDTQVVFLPDKIEDYGSPSELYNKINDYILKNVDVLERDVQICSLYIMQNYLHDKCPVTPILSPRGPPGTGKTRLGEVLTHIAPNGIRGSLTQSYSDIFRDADYWRGTLFLNEGDPKKPSRDQPETEDITKYLNERYEQGSYVGRRDRETLRSIKFKAYGPTIITTREPFPDNATEDRTITILMDERMRDNPTQSDYIPLNLSHQHFEDAKKLRRQLWKFYLDNIIDFKIDDRIEFKGVGSRLNQILQPIASIARKIDGELETTLMEIAQSLQKEKQESRAWSTDGLIMRGYFGLRIQNNMTNSTAIHNFIKENFKIEISPRRITSRFKSMRGMHQFTHQGEKRGKAWRFSKSSEIIEPDIKIEIRQADRYLSQDEKDEILDWLKNQPLPDGTVGTVGTVLYDLPWNLTDKDKEARSSVSPIQVSQVSQVSQSERMQLLVRVLERGSKGDAAIRYELKELGLKQTDDQFCEMIKRAAADNKIVFHDGKWGLM